MPEGRVSIFAQWKIFGLKTQNSGMYVVLKGRNAYAILHTVTFESMTTYNAQFSNKIII